jgi:hypothetical protein
MKSEIFKNEYIEFWYEDEILFSQFSEPIDLTYDNSRKIIDFRNQISRNSKQYWCYDFRNVKSMDKKSRDYAEKNGQNFLFATGAIVKTSVQAFIVNFFIKLKNPKVPFKAFTSKVEAIAWLKELKKQNEQF